MFFFCFLFFWITLAVEVPDSTLKLLETEIKGTIVFPEDSNFQSSSKQWNAQFDDKAPRAIIFCEDRNDIQLAVNLFFYEDRQTTKANFEKGIF